jgi:hypothetical protein
MTMENSERAEEGKAGGVQIADESMAGLQRPLPHARRTDSTIAAQAATNMFSPPKSTIDYVAAPMVDATKTLAAPMKDATKLSRSTSGARQRSFTRIEGMDQLEKPMMHDDSHLSESEKRMKEEELSFYSASDNDHGDDNIWGLLSGVGGNIYEWYVLLWADYIVWKSAMCSHVYFIPTVQVRFCSLRFAGSRNRTHVFPEIVQRIAASQLVWSLLGGLCHAAHWCHFVW